LRASPATPSPAAILSVCAHLPGEAVSVGRAREDLNEQFANLTSDAGW